MFTADVTLEFNVAAKTAVIVDNTDYSTLNLAQVQVTGTGTVVGPDGVAIVSGITIDISAGDTSTTAFNLPLDNTLGILNGTYTLTYVPSFVVTGFSVSQFTAPDTITVASVDWSDIFDETGASNTIDIAGATTPANDGTWAVTSATLNAGDTDFVVVGVIATEAGGSATIDFNVTYNSFVSDIFTYTGCDAVTPSATTPYYCNTTQFGQIVFSDTTVLPTGQTLVSRLWNISYPGNLTNPVTPADVTSALPSVTINTLATGTWTWRLTYNVSVTQTDGLVYTYTASSLATEVMVTCLTTICELRCGIQTLHQQYANAVQGGARDNVFTIPVMLVNSYVIDANNALNCGDQDKFETYAALILQQLELAGVDCNCGCSGETTEEGNHWINNAGFESETQLTTLTEEVQSIAGFASALAGDIAATAAYNAIVADLAIAFSTGANYNAQLGEVQAGIDALNPDDPNFDDSVDLLEASVLSIDTGLANLDIFVQGIVTDINTFNTDFPTYDTLFDSALAQLGSVAGFIAAANALSTTLLTSLQNLTAGTYAADIAGILATLASLQGEVNSLTTYQNLTNSSVNGIYFALGQIIPIILQNQADIASLLSQQSIPEIYAQGYVNELQTTSGGDIPAQYFKGATVNGQFVSGYVSIKTSGRDTSVSLYAIDVYNQTTSQVVATLNATSSNSSFDMDAMLIWVAGNTFTLAGSITRTSGGVTITGPIHIAGIGATKVLPGAINKLVLRSSLATTEFFRTEITGIKLF